MNEFVVKEYGYSEYSRDPNQMELFLQVEDHDPNINTITLEDLASRMGMR